jgi:asparagine synthase (glutamine-hydrolysing)
MTPLLDPRRHWRTRQVGAVTVHDAGDRGPVDAVARAFATGGYDAAQSTLAGAVGQFAAVLEGPAGTLAFVDHCRSIPLFHDGARMIANDARLVLAEMRAARADETSVLEAGMAGYVTGPYTLYRDLFQLQAGELLFRPAGGDRATTAFYFVYRPAGLRGETAGELADELGAVTDRIVRRVIAAAAGVPVWVPLSAGLDSRLLLCKLVEHGCPNLQSFSYGPPGNDEARAARRVAETLGVPWRFVPSCRRSMQQFFASEMRHGYWNFSDGVCSVPNPQDILPLVDLMGQGVVRAGDMIVNGQSGDFINGGHIPQQFIDCDADVAGLFDAIVAKHFSLWSSLKTPENLARIRARVLSELGLSGSERFSGQDAAALYEQWEYQERQSKFVVNGQRIYDFLGLQWRLPLWDQEFIIFWRDIPAPVKFAKRLYCAYLDRYDYRGLFRNYSPAVWHWPGVMKGVLPLARLVRLTRGPKARDRFLKSLLYFGMFRHLYAPYRYRDFLAHFDDLRSPISLHVATWLHEQGLSQPGLPAL